MKQAMKNLNWIMNFNLESNTMQKVKFYQLIWKTLF